MKKKILHTGFILFTGLLLANNTIAQITNGGFETGDNTGWNLINVGSDGAASTNTFTKEAVNVKEGTYALSCEVVEPGPNDWDIQLRNESVIVNKDSAYLFSFWAKATVDGAQMITQVEDIAVGWPPLYRPGLFEGADLMSISTNWTYFSYVYIPVENFNAVDKVFAFGVRPRTAANYFFDAFKVTPIKDFSTVVTADLSTSGTIINIHMPASIDDPADEEKLTVKADGVVVNIDSVKWNDTARLTIMAFLPQSISNANKVEVSYDKSGFLTFSATGKASVPSFNVNVAKSAGTRVNSALAENVSVFPTLTSGIINIKAAKQISQVNIITALGQNVKTVKLNAASGYINISDLKSGIYFVVTQMKDNTSTVTRIIKK